MLAIEIKSLLEQEKSIQSTVWRTTEKGNNLHLSGLSVLLFRKSSGCLISGSTSHTTNLYPIPGTV